MKYLLFSFLTLMSAMFLVTSCNKDDDTTCTETTWYQDADDDGLGNPDVSQTACDQPEGYVADNSDSNDTGSTSTPLSAFDEFNADAVTFSFDDNEVTIESNGLPNHTSPYWEKTHPLHIEQVVGDHVTPGFISSRSFTVTLPLNPPISLFKFSYRLGCYRNSCYWSTYF